jgi:SAM-dependent methyltransferase
LLADVAASLRSGRAPSDEQFDQVYDDWWRWISPHYWTPVAVARQAAQLLIEGGCKHILDIGSGVGKFCIVGALATGARFVGVEQRPKLVETARTAAARLGAKRVAFVAGDFAEVDFSGFDGFYLFNPFEELIAGGVLPIDDSIDISLERFHQHLLSLTSKLQQTRSGVNVVTYFGHGGRHLRGFRQVGKQRIGQDALILWRRE